MWTRPVNAVRWPEKSVVAGFSGHRREDRVDPKVNAAKGHHHAGLVRIHRGHVDRFALSSPPPFARPDPSHTPPGVRSTLCRESRVVAGFCNVDPVLTRVYAELANSVVVRAGRVSRPAHVDRIPMPAAPALCPPSGGPRRSPRGSMPAK